jgi:S-DNA-T family DNA segregation ATPase FtsK/SpoIIIE
VVVERYQRLTSELVERALGSLGITAMTAKGARITFPVPIQRDGNAGWRAEVDLPYGVTATDVIERRDRLSAGLRRPLGCVWPEQVSEQHSGRLVLFVADEDMAKAKQAPWPLRKARKASIFEALPFGTDRRYRPVGVDLMYSNLVIGALPGAGKTFALRVIVLGAATDPTCEP